MPEKPRLDAFRQAIADDPERVRSILEDPTLVAAFGPVHPHELYKRVPPGYPDEIRSPAVPDILTDAWAAAMPLFRFLETLRA